MTKKLTREYVEFQSDRIEAVLASHRIPVQVHGGVISPAWVRFHFTAAPTAKLSRLRGLTEEIALALGAPAVRIARDGDILAIEVPRLDRQPVRLLPLLRKVMANTGIQSITACLGLTQQGHPLLLRLPAPDVAHVLVAGATGSGKTELMRAILFSLAASNRQHKLQLALIDPKARGFGPLAFLPHLIAPIATDINDAIDLLDRLLAEMDQRDARSLASPRIVIAIDEVVDLLMVGGKRVEMALARIAQRGREAGLHLVLGAQKPAASVLGPHLKANLPVRLVGRVGSLDDARVAAGVSASGAEKLTGYGDFIAVCGGDIIHFQSACVSADDLAELRRLIPARAPWLAEPQT
ncbi:MAG TPA: DNA translocase FtsK [Anaerolineales bacterium]|nr:DNA translocase FtsK [Anaerolineales bacterium]